MTDREKIEEALDEMSMETDIAWKGGTWICCQTCGHAEFEMNERLKADSYVFWHAQSEERAFGVEERYPKDDDEYEEAEYEMVFSDHLQDTLMIYHSDVSAASTAVRYLEMHGVKVDWDGNGYRAIQVLPA